MENVKYIPGMEIKNQELLKEAEKAADKLAEKYYHQPLKDTAIHEGFMAGIKWHKEYTWHPFDEEPKATPCNEYGIAKSEDVIQLLVITKDDEVKIMYSTHEDEFERDEEGYWLFHDEDCNTYDPFNGDIKEWAYLDDVKKGGAA